MNSIGLSRKSALRLIGFLSLCLAFFPLVKSQEDSQWRIVERLPAQTQKASYLGGADSSAPDSGRRAPTLEAIFFHNTLNGWAVGDNGVLLFTLNGGKTWNPCRSSLPANLRGVFFNNERQGWVVGDSKGAGEIHRTIDGGQSWQLQKRIEGFELSGLHSIWFADGKAGWAVGEAQQGGVVQGVIFATKDGGIHWELQYQAERRSTGLNAVKFVGAQRGWVVGHNVILHTENGGQLWHEQYYGDGEYFFDVDFVNSNEGWVVGSDGSQLYTGNGGGVWQAGNLPSGYRNVWLASVRFINSSRGWIAGDNGAILSTVDGGQTWRLESSGTDEYLRSLALTPRNIFAAGNGGLILRRPI